MHFDRGLEIIGIILISIIVSFLICLFFPISFLWMLTIIPLDFVAIIVKFIIWAKQDSKADKRELAGLDAM